MEIKCSFKEIYILIRIDHRTKWKKKPETIPNPFPYQINLYLLLLLQVTSFIINKTHGPIVLEHDFLNIDTVACDDQPTKRRRNS